MPDRADIRGPLSARASSSVRKSSSDDDVVPTHAPNQGRSRRDAERFAVVRTVRGPGVCRQDESLVMSRGAALPERVLTPARVQVLQTSIGNRAVSHMLAQTQRRRRPPRPLVRPGSAQPHVQREMKFEFQTSNTVFRNDGTHVEVLERKYGPKDFLVEGSSGVRLESETNGVLEFETGWSRKWSKLKEQIDEAMSMTDKMNAASAASGGRKQFPFAVPSLRTGTRKEMRSGKWGRRKGKEGSNERILRTGEQLEVGIDDPSWKAGIQSSESFLLNQYESYLKEHATFWFKTSAIVKAATILAEVDTKGLAADRIENLRNFLEIILDYIKHGQGGPATAATTGFSDVHGVAAKQAFARMSRTSFTSMYKDLLSKEEQALFLTIVRKGSILDKMGIDRSTPFFVAGYGMHEQHKGPTVHAWLSAIPRQDLLSTASGEGISGAMGRFGIEKRKGKPDTGLVKFETRADRGPVFATAENWLMHALQLFLSAAVKRRRPAGKDQTGLTF